MTLCIPWMNVLIFFHAAIAHTGICLTRGNGFAIKLDNETSKGLSTKRITLI